MLYILHSDKNDTQREFFIDEELRIDLGKFPTQNTHIRLRMVGWNSNDQDADVHLSFPDLAPQYYEEELIDATDAYEVLGVVFSATEGSLWGDNRTKDGNDVISNNQGGVSSFGRGSDTRIVDLHLGKMDTQKDYFRVIVNARRASRVNTHKNTLNNVSVVLEVHHGSIMG